MLATRDYKLSIKATYIIVYLFKYIFNKFKILNSLSKYDLCIFNYTIIFEIEKKKHLHIKEFF